MADRSVSVPMTLSDFERPDATNQFFFRRILITLVRSATSYQSFAQMRRAVCQRQLSFLFSYAADRQTQDDSTVKPWRMQLFQNRLNSITDFFVLILILHCMALSM